MNKTAACAGAVLCLLACDGQAQGIVTGNAFNPAFSVIFDGTYNAFSADPEGLALPGLPLGGEGEVPPRGPALRETELVMSGSIDDRWYGRLTLPVALEDGETALELEEGFVETVGLGYGLGVRLGRFYSRLGYENARHPHSWYFVTRPLPYTALVGGAYGDTGARLTWLLPSDLYGELAVEHFSGAAYPFAAAPETGSTGLNLRLGGDVGEEHAWLASLGTLWGRAQGRPAGTTALDGRVCLHMASLVWKWARHGDPSQQNLVLQAEYLWRSEDGTLTGSGASGDYRGRHRGGYLQAVLQPHRQWRVGLRHARVHADNTLDPALGAASGVDAGRHAAWVSSAVLTFARSEFSRLRLQWDWDRRAGRDRRLILQYQMSLGAHGAHQF